MGLLKSLWTVKSLDLESHREILSGVKSVHFESYNIDLEVFFFNFVRWSFIFGYTVYTLSLFSVTQTPKWTSA